jgi:hypothetical protein
MKCPVPCIRCGELLELNELRHSPICQCSVYDSCCNYLCGECYLEEDLDLRHELNKGNGYDYYR